MNDVKSMSNLDQAEAVAEELRTGLFGAESIPALPARWLDGVPMVETHKAGEWMVPLGGHREVYG